MLHFSRSLPRVPGVIFLNERNRPSFGFTAARPVLCRVARLFCDFGDKIYNNEIDEKLCVSPGADYGKEGTLDKIILHRIAEKSRRGLVNKKSEQVLR